MLNILPLAGVKDEVDARIVELAPQTERAPSVTRSASGGLTALTADAGSAARRGRVRPQLRAAVRQAARLLRHRVGVRAAHVRARATTRRAIRSRRSAPTSTCPPTTCYIEITTLQAEAGDQEEPQGAQAAGASPRRQGQDPLPAGLPQPAREVRARVAVAPARHAHAAPGRASTAPVELGPPEAADASASDARTVTARRRPPRLGAKMVRFGGWEMPPRTRRAPSPSTGRVARTRWCSTSATSARSGSPGPTRFDRLAGGAHQRPRPRSGRAGPSTRTCSTRPTRRCSTTSSCGGSSTSAST